MVSKRYGGFSMLVSAALAAVVCSASSAHNRAVPRGAVAPVRRATRPFVDSAAIARATKLIAVSDAENDAVSVYDASGKTLAVLSDFTFPQGLANDIGGNLFVADQGNNRIQVYGRGFNGKPRTLSDPGQYPVSVAAFAGGKYVAVVNQYTTSYGPGNVIVYVNGVPGEPISDPSIAQASFAAFDANGNLYVDFSPKNGTCPCVGVIAGATNGGTTLALLRTSNVIAPNGLQVTASGRIAIFDDGSNTIDTYDPPSHGSLGSPVSRTALGSSLDSPAEFAFSDDMRDVYVANSSDNNSLYEFSFPAGHALESISVGGIPYGVAVFPKEYPR